MNQQWELPEPDSAARAHSARLQALIRERIRAAAGWISFADFMQLALYAPGLGYYSAGATKFGPAGDFVTAPEISPLFSRCVAGQCAEVLSALGGGDILEPGAGSGVMAATMLAELARLECLPERYLILEPSADLQARQAATLEQLEPAVRARVSWLRAAPEQPLRGVIVANEVADALPVRRFVIADGIVHELGVTLAAGEFQLSTCAADTAFSQQALAAVGDPDVLTTPYVSEISMQLPAWVAALSEWLDEGVALIIDYGFSRREYYAPERCAGTLRCYYRHRAHDDPLRWPGLQDITSWVDFSWLAEAAHAAGFHVSGYTTQAQFLLAGGLEQLLQTPAATDAREQAVVAAGLRTLLLPGEMGESVKVMALSRGGAAAPQALQGRDMRVTL